MTRLNNSMANLATLTFSKEWIDNLFSTGNRVRVGLSGGVDSCVLLHALVSQLSNEQKQQVSAIHVHHGLSDNADEWLKFCEDFCQSLNVSFVAERVALAEQGSIEEAARNARYQVFEQTLGAHDVLFLAHHAGDQVETVLFRLLRGTGGKGLSGMPYQRDIGEQGAYLVRPFLDASKADIEAYAEIHKLQWVEDESNTDEQFSRNYLRHSVVPSLQQRFPSLESNIVSTAQRIETDYSMLAKLSHQQLASWSDEFGGLVLSHLAELPLDDKAFWVRQFLAKFDISLPHAQLISVTNMFFGENDRQPEQVLQNKRLLRHQGTLYLLPQELPVVLGSLPNGEWLNRSFDKVRVVSSSACELKTRPLGVDLAMPSGHSRRLKKWLNDLQIPSWWREHLPYVYQQGELVAIGDLWVHPEWEGEVEWEVSGLLPLPRKKR
ncbi:tRNA lysidine(34) synthetase TilS [Marinomonas sp. C2222]|uniref:tRNA(Ile)-lysidine synthase n=1 Tax=Marinomonas sargassi TaxID=2984494 RepID=A0ABT2YV70_9GAMM|nr:tRNA lysidine(34) synthetase TilS [Marinomonas sargassi]MCV2403798.1 tRNA lysidine(34) synthetase TilS [Marinomonas sargassi]